MEKVNYLSNGQWSLIKSTPSYIEEGVNHEVEVHPDIDNLLRVKSFVNSSSTPLKITHIKKKFGESLADKVPRDSHGKVSGEMIDKHIEKLPKTKLIVKAKPYTWESQKHAPNSKQQALSVHIHPDTYKKMNPEMKDTLDNLLDNQHEMSDSKKSQIGWSRIDPYDKPGHWHVDEIQSDFQNKDKIDRSNDHKMTHAAQIMQDASKEDHPLNSLWKDHVEEANKAKASGWDHSKMDKFYLVQKKLKDGVAKLHKETYKEPNISADDIHKVLSHNHEDPQHLIHSAVNALARKHGINSTSMDTPRDQAKQSGLRGRGRNDNFEDRVSDATIDLMADHHGDHWKIEKEMLRNGNHPAFNNPNFKTALDKIGGIDVLEKLADQSAGTGSSVDLDNNATMVDDDSGHKTEADGNGYQDGPYYKKIKSLSDPEKHVLEETLLNHYNNVRGSAEQQAREDNASYDDQEDYDYQEEPLKVPVHQMDTYDKRPKKLGMEERSKKEVLPNSGAQDNEKVQYSPVYKSKVVISPNGQWTLQ